MKHNRLETVILLSALGLTTDGKTDNTTAVQAAFDAIAANPLGGTFAHDVDGGTLLVSGLDIDTSRIIGNHAFTIRTTGANGTWKLRDWSDRPILWNKNRSNVLISSAAYTDHDIQVRGGKWDFNGFDGDGIQRQHPQICVGTAVTPTPIYTGVTGADNNTICAGMLFAGVLRPKISKIRVVGAPRFYALCFGHCKDDSGSATIRDIVFDVPMQHVNGDGVHRHGDCLHIDVAGSVGGLGDDTDACNASDCTPPSSRFANPPDNSAASHFGGHSCVYYRLKYDGAPGDAKSNGWGGSNPGQWMYDGPITGHSRDIDLTDSCLGIRAYGGHANQVLNITYSNITGTALGRPSIFNNIIGAAPGDGAGSPDSTLTIDGWRVAFKNTPVFSLGGELYYGSLKLNQHFRRVILKNVTDAQQRTRYPVVQVAKEAGENLGFIRQFDVVNFVSVEETPFPNRSLWEQRTPAGTLNVAGLTWTNAAAAANRQFFLSFKSSDSGAVGGFQAVSISGYSGPEGRLIDDPSRITAFAGDAFKTIPAAANAVPGGGAPSSIVQILFGFVAPDGVTIPITTGVPTTGTAGLSLTVNGTPRRIAVARIDATHLTASIASPVQPADTVAVSCAASDIRATDGGHTLQDFEGLVITSGKEQ